MEQIFFLVHEKKNRVVQNFFLVHEKKYRVGKNFKIVKRSCSLNRYYRESSADSFSWSCFASCWIEAKIQNSCMMKCFYERELRGIHLYNGSMEYFVEKFLGLIKFFILSILFVIAFAIVLAWNVLFSYWNLTWIFETVMKKTVSNCPHK